MYRQDFPRGLNKGALKGSELGWEEKVYFKEMYNIVF